MTSDHMRDVLSPERPSENFGTCLSSYCSRTDSVACMQQGGSRVACCCCFSSPGRPIPRKPRLGNGMRTTTTPANQRIIGRCQRSNARRRLVHISVHSCHIQWRRLCSPHREVEAAEAHLSHLFTLPLPLDLHSFDPQQAEAPLLPSSGSTLSTAISFGTASDSFLRSSTT